MTIDKQKLRALAEPVNQGNWIQEGLDAQDDGIENYRVANCRSDEEAAFIAAASPATVLALLAEIERLQAGRSRKERELEQELEVWRHGPSCWSCGDTGDVHDLTGEWHGECDCLAAQLINANRERDQFKAENEALRKDAERYRWFRDSGKDWYRLVIQDSHGRIICEEVDAHIDAAMAKEANRG